MRLVKGIQSAQLWRENYLKMGRVDGGCNAIVMGSLLNAATVELLTGTMPNHGATVAGYLLT